MDKVFSRRLVAPENMQIVNPALLTDLSPFIHYSFFPSLPRCRPMCRSQHGSASQWLRDFLSRQDKIFIFYFICFICVTFVCYWKCNFTCLCVTLMTNVKPESIFRTPDIRNMGLNNSFSVEDEHMLRKG